MPFEYKLIGNYHEDNPYRVGDKVKWKRTDEIMTVGDDWDELNYWCPNGGDKTHIVTTSGRVLAITEVERV
jgi:hypothetical protein